MWRDYDKWLERYRIPKLDKIVVSYIFTIKKSSIKILENKKSLLALKILKQITMILTLKNSNNFG